MFDEPGGNLIEPQTRLGVLTVTGAARFEGCDARATRFPATMIQASEGSPPFSHVAENRLATASMAVRSCFFRFLMHPCF